MSRISQRATVVGIALTLGAGVAQAQIPQNVDYPILRTGSGAAYAIDFARGNSDAGENNYAGVRVAPPWSKLGVWAGAGIFDGATTNLVAGAGLAVALLDNPAIPVTLLAEGGAGYSEGAGVSRLRVPIGVTAVLTAPNGAGFEPWIRPMLLIERSGGTTDIGLGAAAGFDVFGAAGFGFHVTTEVSSIRGQFPLLVGVGLHYMVGLGSVL